MVEVKKARLVAILIALGHKAAGKWDQEKLGTKASTILPEAAENDEAVAKLDEKQTVSFNKLVKAINAEKDWGIIMPSDNGKPAKDDDKPAKKKTKEASGAPKERIGVVQFVFDLLTKASKSNPLYVEEAMKPVLKKFGPDSKYERTESGLRQTVQAQLGFQFKNYKGYDVRKTDERPAGFWLKDTKTHPELVGDWKKSKGSNGKADKKKSKKKAK